MNDRTDNEIIAAFNERNEKAINDLRGKYGRACEGIASGILTDARDREECIDDALLSLWNSIPPARPESLKAYLFTAVRRGALMILRKKNADKRASDTEAVPLMEELTEGYAIPDETETVILRDALNRFLATLSEGSRTVFLRRYYYGMSLIDIAECGGLSLSAVKVSLSRSRASLKDFLHKEDIYYEHAFAQRRPRRLQVGPFPYLCHAGRLGKGF